MSLKIRPLAAQAYEQVAEDTKLIRLTTITTITHSIAFLIYLGYTVLTLVSKGRESDSPLGTFYHSIATAFEGQYALRFITIAAILFIGYWLMPSIGEATIINYLHDTDKQGKKSLAKGLADFFPMFEYHGMIAFFTPVIFVIVVSRFFALGIYENVFIIIISVLRAFFVLFVSTMLAYTNYFIVLEDKKPFDAMKSSMSMTMENFSVTFKTVVLQYLLSLRFILNIIIFLGLPLLILYGATKFNIEKTGPLATVVIVISTLVGLLVAYINGIIEAFFLSLRYRLYMRLKQQ